jgi:hypothetical protein
VKGEPVRFVINTEPRDRGALPAPDDLQRCRGCGGLSGHFTMRLGDAFDGGDDDRDID